MKDNIQPRITGLFQHAVEVLPLFDEIPVAISLLDSDRRIIALNRAAEVLTGFTREQAEGVPCRHILHSNVCVHNCPLETMQPDSEPVRLQGDIINRDR